MEHSIPFCNGVEPYPGLVADNVKIRRGFCVLVLRS